MTEDTPLSGQSIETHHDSHTQNGPSGDSQPKEIYDHTVLLHYEQRIQSLENDVQALKQALQEDVDAQDQERVSFREKSEEFDLLRKKVREALHASAASNRMIHTFEKRVDSVKRYATSGMAASVLIFSILLVITILVSSS